MKISVVGAAGVVGSALAYTIADQGLADEVVMLDTRQNVLMNHMMDIAVAAGRYDMTVRAGDYPDIAGSDLVIISAGLHFTGAVSVREKLDANVPIMQGIAQNVERYCPDAVVITATNPIDLLNYAVYNGTSLLRERLLGYNMNDSLRFRIAAAKALGVKPTRVTGLVLGIHPEKQVMLFSSLRVDGKPVTLDPATKKRVRDEAADYLRQLNSWQAGRTAGWTTAAGLAAVIRGIATDSGEIMPASVVVNGEYGYERLSIGLPVVIGKKGIRQVLQWELPPDERQELDEAARTLSRNAALVREIAGRHRP